MWIKKEAEDTVEVHAEHIRVVIDALKSEGADYMTQDSNTFGKYYKRYIDRFNKAVEMINKSNDVELHPIEDPRLLIAQTITHFLMDDDEILEFGKEFGITSTKQVAGVLPDNTLKAELDHHQRHLKDI